MALTIDNFLKPAKGNAAFNLNDKINDYKKRYFEKIAKDILVSCVYNDHRESYTFFFKVPSEENDKYPTAVTYDVMLEFLPNKKLGKTACKAQSDLNNYEIYVYSNSPSFVFTFDYVIKHKFNGFPRALPNNYLSHVAITKAPEIRNLYQIMTVEKTTWWAFFHLYHNGYLTKETIKTIISKNNERYFINKMMTQPKKLKEINDLKIIMKEEKLKEKAGKSNRENSKHYSKISPENKDPLTYSFQVANKNILRVNPLKKSLLGKNTLKTNMKYKW